MRITLHISRILVEFEKLPPLEPWGLRNYRLKMKTLLVYYFLEIKNCRISDNFAWLCICIPDSGYFSFLDANAECRMTGLALNRLYRLQACAQTLCSY